jgi:hypothetical protein
MKDDSDVTEPTKAEAADAGEAKPAAKPESRSGRKPTRTQSDAARAAAIYERLDSETMDFVPAQASADPAPEVAASPAAPVKKKAPAVRKKAAAVKKKATAVAGADPEATPPPKAPEGTTKPAADGVVRGATESSEEAVDPAQAVDSEEESSIISGSD